MNWLVFLPAFVFDSQSEEDLIRVKKALYFENNFFGVSKEQVNNYFLYKVHVSVEGGSTNLGIEYFQKTCRCFLFDFQRNSNLGVNYSLKNFYSLKSTNKSYGKLSDWMTKDVYYSFLKHSEVHKGFLKFQFYFIDKPTIGNISLDKYSDIQIYQTYRLPAKDCNDTIC